MIQDHFSCVVNTCLFVFVCLFCLFVCCCCCCLFFFVFFVGLKKNQTFCGSSQCSTTGVTKAVVCAILSEGWCIKKNPCF